MNAALFQADFAALLYSADVAILTAIKRFEHKDKNILLDIYTALTKKRKPKAWRCWITFFENCQLL